MTYRILASDYDGTIAEHGSVSVETLTALEALRDSGRLLILVTGRQLPDLMHVFPALKLCTRIVAENGALLYDPATGREELLAPPPGAEVASQLRARGVPMHVGRVIQATDTVYLAEVEAVLRETRAELEIILNKDALMILPRGVDKGTGLRAALTSLSLSSAETIGVGDAENDLPLFAASGAGVALDNALPSLKARARWITRGAAGTGVVQLIQAWLSSDFSALER